MLVAWILNLYLISTVDNYVFVVHLFGVVESSLTSVYTK
jgi:hypothetical protein